MTLWRTGLSRSLVQGFGKGLEAVVAGCVAGMVLINAVDVVGRSLLSAPLIGAAEWTGVLMIGCVFAALPLATSRNEHIAVDLFGHLFPPALKTGFRAGWLAIGAIGLGVAAWQLWRYAGLIRSDQLPLIGLPIWPFVVFASACCALTALVFAGKLAVLRHSRTGGDA